MLVGGPYPVGKPSNDHPGHLTKADRPFHLGVGYSGAGGEENELLVWIRGRQGRHCNAQEDIGTIPKQNG